MEAKMIVPAFGKVSIAKGGDGIWRVYHPIYPRVKHCSSFESARRRFYHTADWKDPLDFEPPRPF